MNKFTKKNAIKINKSMLKVLNKFEISEKEYINLSKKFDTLSIAIPASANNSVEEFINTTLEALVFTDERDINEIQKQRRLAKLEWKKIADTQLRTLVVD
ncbi:MAG: hypothetical protein ACI4JV_04440 [Ruminiclostridium sp.]